MGHLASLSYQLAGFCHLYLKVCYLPHQRTRWEQWCVILHATDDNSKNKLMHIASNGELASNLPDSDSSTSDFGLFLRKKKKNLTLPCGQSGQPNFKTQSCLCSQLFPSPPSSLARVEGQATWADCPRVWRTEDTGAWWYQHTYL